MKKWFLTRMIAMCNYCLTYKCAAETQEDINEVVMAKNFFIRKLNNLDNKQNK